MATRMTDLLPEGEVAVTATGKVIPSLKDKPSRGLTVAELAALDAKKLAEAKERNTARKKEKQRLQMGKVAVAKHYQHKETSGQLEMLMTQILKQFINELKGKPLLDCDFTNKDSVARRRDHLVVINSTMGVIRSLRELKEVIADDEKTASKQDVMTPENTAMMDAAKQMLAATENGKRKDGNVIMMEDAKELLSQSGLKSVM